MNRIYMNIDITYYDHGITPRCYIYEAIDNKPGTLNSIPFEQARKLAWELVLAGGKRKYETNSLTPHIHTVTVSYWARH